MDEQAPPPYTPHDSYAAPPSPNSNSYSPDSPVQTSIRGGYVRRNDIPTEPAFASAAFYFEERPCQIQRPNSVLRHYLNLMPDTTRNDLPFPQPADRYRARDLNDADWHTFISYLLPVAYVDRSKAPAQTMEGDPEQQQRLSAVIAEWNEGFFGPRGILLHYEPTYSPSSSRAVPDQTESYAVPPNYHHHHDRGTSHDHSRQERWRSDKKFSSRSRSSSTSSSSSSSSSSSTISVASISSRDLDGLNNAQVQQPLNTFRQNARVNLVTAVAQLRSELRSQPRISASRGNDRRAIAERQKMQREIKSEVRSLVRSTRDMKRAWRQERKALRRERKQARQQLKRENRSLWRQEKQNYKAAKREAKHERRMQKRASKIERKSAARLLPEVRTPQTGFRGQDTGVLAGGPPNVGAPRATEEKAGF